MSQVMTRADCVDQMRDQYASKVLKSDCILDTRLTLEQLSNEKFACNTRQDRSSCRNALRPECGGKPLEGWYLISDLERKMGL